MTLSRLSTLRDDLARLAYNYAPFEDEEFVKEVDLYKYTKVAWEALDDARRQVFIHLADAQIEVMRKHMGNVLT